MSQLDDIISDFVSRDMTARAATREKQILGIVRPRPWWMPKPLWRYLLTRLTTIVITQKQVPLAFRPIDLQITTRKYEYDIPGFGELMRDITPPFFPPGGGVV